MGRFRLGGCCLDGCCYDANRTRFWFTAELNPTWPVLLRIDAESGLGHIRMEYVGAN